MDATQLKTVREVIGVAKGSGALSAPVSADLTALNAKIIDGTYLELKDQTPTALALFALLNAASTQAEPSYVVAVKAIISELAGSIPLPPPPPPPPPPTGGGLSATELQTIADINFLTRAALNHTGPLTPRLYAMNMAIAEGTWRTWSDPDKAYVLGVMRGTPEGVNFSALLEAFAAELGLVITPLPLPGGVTPPPAPPPAPSPVVNPPAPPAPGEEEYPVLTEADRAWLTAAVADGVIAVLESRNLKLRGEVEIHNRLFVGDAIAKGRAEGYESAYAVQIMCDKSSTISGVSNLDRLQFQNLTPHFGYFTFNYDGGILHVQNAGYLFRDGVFKGVDFIDPTREISTAGVDSRGTWVYDLREPGREYVEGDKTQTVWIRPDEDAKTVDISAPRVGFTFRLRGSSRRDPILKVILDRVKQLLWD